MDAVFEQEVRERAYEIWMATGMEDGSADLHWFSAERAMKSDVTSVAKQAGAKAKSAKAKSTAAKSTSAKPGVKTVGKAAKAKGTDAVYA